MMVHDINLYVICVSTRPEAKASPKRSGIISAGWAGLGIHGSMGATPWKW